LSNSRRLSLSLLFTVCLFLLTGCPAVNTPVPPVEQLLPSQSDFGAGRLDPNQPVHVYLDGTLSMRGFAQPHEGKFGQLLQELDLSLSSLGPRDRIHYHRFGSVIEDIPQRPFYVTASQQSFFQGTPKYATTRIDTVFKSSPPNGLTIVLSDLFEQDLDIASVQDALKSAGFPQKATLGIWQWEIPFDGQIYDFELKASGGHPYSGLRPLYMLALGPEEFLRKWQESLSRTLSTGSPNFLLLGQHLAANPYSWLTVKQTQHMALLRSSPGNAGIPYAEYRVPSGCTSVQIDAEQNLRPVENTVIPALQPHPSAYSAELFSIKQNGTKLAANPLSSVAVQENSPTKLSVVVQCSALPGNGLYLLRIQRVGSAGDLVFPSWVTATSVNASQLSDSFQKHDPHWGDKTINLLPLLRELAVTAVDNVAIGTSYFYLSKT
jgi:hypothetical protein